MDDPVLATTTPTTDAAVLLRALGALSAQTFADDAAAVRAYLDLAMQLLGVRSAFTAQLTPEAMYVLASEDRDGCGIPVDGIVPLEETFCQYVRMGGEPVCIPDAAHDPRVADVATRHQFTIGSYLGVPLRRRDGSLLGTLCALDPSPRPFTTLHVAFLQMIASQVSGYIERGYLHELITRVERDTTADLHATLDSLAEQTTVLKIVSHDVRSPLTTIFTAIELLLLEVYGPVPEEQQAVLHNVRDASHFIHRLLTDLLDAVTVEQPCFTLATDEFDPATLAQQALALCSAQAVQRGLELQLDIHPQLPHLLGDEDRLQQVLLNLLSNALHYTPAGRVLLRVAPFGEGVEFRVEDSGIGITPEMQAQIWSSHTRASERSTGFGLGLYVVQRLVQAMGGSVGMTSEPGRGSSFWVRLPLQGPRPRRVQW